MRGMKTGGRKKGTPNKTTAALKDNIMSAFERMGGEEALLAWAMDNQEAFFTKVLTRILPRQLDAEIKHTLVDDLSERLMTAKQNAETSRKSLN